LKLYLGRTPCSTPDPGYCISFKNCQHILVLIEQHMASPDPNVSNYLLKSVCGYEKTEPRVCCPTQKPKFLTSTVSASPVVNSTILSLTTKSTPKSVVPTSAPVNPYSFIFGEAANPTQAPQGFGFTFASIGGSNPNPITITQFNLPTQRDGCGISNASRPRGLMPPFI
jgi:hypothetical protein